MLSWRRTPAFVNLSSPARSPAWYAISSWERQRACCISVFPRNAFCALQYPRHTPSAASLLPFVLHTPTSWRFLLGKSGGWQLCSPLFQSHDAGSCSAVKWKENFWLSSCKHWKGVYNPVDIVAAPMPDSKSFALQITPAQTEQGVELQRSPWRCWLSQKCLILRPILEDVTRMREISGNDWQLSKCYMLLLNRDIASRMTQKLADRQGIWKVGWNGNALIGKRKEHS